MRIARIVVGVFWTFLVATAFGQAKPDFSGKWIQIDPATTESDTSMTVSQDATTVTILHASPASVPQRLALRLDGTPTMFTMPRTGAEHAARAQWDGDRVVISLEAYSNGYGPYTVRMTWSLDGDRLTVATAAISRTTGATFSEGKISYRKA